MSGWLRAATSKTSIVRGLKVAAIVGTVLTLINYGDHWYHGVFLTSMYWKVPLTYLVPFCVSTYAGIDATRKDTNQ